MEPNASPQTPDSNPNEPAASQSSAAETAPPASKPGLAAPEAPADAVPPTPTPGVVVGGEGNAPAKSAEPAPAPGPAAAGAGPRGLKLRLTKPVIGVIAAVLVVGGAAAFYFGYYTNPSVIYSKSLQNTGKGYDKLVQYADKQSQLHYKAFVGDGSFKVKGEGFATDGKINFKGDENNGELTFDLGLGATRLKADLRAIKSAGASPDLYIKASGLKGLGSLAGSPELESQLAGLDDSWVLIDHSLIDSLNAATADQPATVSNSPTREQVLDELQAVGKVNQQYVYTTNKDKAIFTVVKKYGSETVDGHKTYHYKVGVQKENVKKYIKAQQAALKASKLNDWIKKNKYETTVNAMFDDMARSANDIKASDNFDLWADAKRKLIYKVRFADTKNPAQNYADLGLDYKGGDSYPFFIKGKSKDGDTVTDINLTFTLNTKNNDLAMKVDTSTEGDQPSTFNMDVTFKPSNQTFKIEKPAGAKTLAEALSALGLGDYLTQLQAMSAAQAATPAGGTDGSLFQ